MRVAVLGAGYAGLTVARKLEQSLPEAVELVVVNDASDHLVQHELHRLIRHPALADAITVPLSDVLTRSTVREATVTDVDTDAGVASIDAGEGEETLEYDFAAVCLGATANFYDLDGVEEYATPLKRIEDAEKIRAAAREQENQHAVVAGAGLSGIQTAGELAELAEEDDLDLEITLVEMADQIAPGFDSTFINSIRRELEDRDVSISTGVAVESADEDVVHLASGDSLPADLFVWTGGIRGSAAMNEERAQTGADLRVSESTFVVGDAADLVDVDGDAVPATAQTAIGQADIAATNIQRLVRAKGDFTDQADSISIPVSDGSDDESAAQASGEETLSDGEIEPHDEALAQYDLSLAGWVISVGNGAVAKVGPFVYSGEPARATKAVIAGQHLGSVGAIHQASKLVAEELGWPTTDGDGIGKVLESANLSPLPIDLSAPNDQVTQFATFAAEVSEHITKGNTVDLTPVTRATDHENPGSPLFSMGKLLFDTADAALDFSGANDTEPIEIELESGETQREHTDDSSSDANGESEPRDSGSDGSEDSE